MKIIGRFIVLKAFTLKRKGDEIVADEPGDFPILGEYHAGHTYRLTQLTKGVIEKLQETRRCVITAATDPGLKIG